MALWSYEIIEAARVHGFELAGIAQALPIDSDYARFRSWVQSGHAGKMGYLTDHRAGLRADPRTLLPSAQSILCVGKLYNCPVPPNAADHPERGWVARYAWGEDYHATMRKDLEALVAHLRTRADFEYRICIDTAPLLERSYARQAGLGWIGKNTCLINQQEGSWFLLGEVLLSLELEPGTPPPDRCGSCTRCIDACPTTAIVPDEGNGGWKLDASLCISYFTIELKGAIPDQSRAAIGNHIFGCDICQDVCPWNRRAPVTAAAEFQPREGAYSPELATLVNLTGPEFRQYWQGSPVTRTRYSGFLRNVAVAMGNSRLEQFREPLQRLAGSEEEIVREHALWALQQLDSGSSASGDTRVVDGPGPPE